MIRSHVIAVACLAVFFALPAHAAGKRVDGRIKSFECGDNCYLTIVTKSGKELNALCAAKACEPWNAETEIPRDLIGRKVRVTLDTGVQLDGSGNEMGSYPAFTVVKLK